MPEALALALAAAAAAAAAAPAPAPAPAPGEEKGEVERLDGLASVEPALCPLEPAPVITPPGDEDTAAAPGADALPFSTPTGTGGGRCCPCLSPTAAAAARGSKQQVEGAVSPPGATAASLPDTKGSPQLCSHSSTSASPATEAFSGMASSSPPEVPTPALWPALAEAALAPASTVLTSPSSPPPASATAAFVRDPPSPPAAASGACSLLLTPAASPGPLPSARRLSCKAGS